MRLRLRIGLWLVALIASLIFLGLFVKEFSRNLVDDSSRFHLLFVDSSGARVSLASFDPIEQKIVVIEYPPELTIASRSVGTYEIRNLYTLGSYKGNGGEFARRKMQGFMKLPIVGYMVNSASSAEIERSLKDSLLTSIFSRQIESNLSWFDRIRLYREITRSSVRLVGQDELIRAGILEPSDNSTWSYNSERLNIYVGASLFDWSVGKEGATVAIINESGLDGMGGDFASFLTSLGLDVVMVKSGSTVRDETSYSVGEPKRFERALKLIDRVFTFGPYKIESTEEYRSDIVFWIGLDMVELF